MNPIVLASPNRAIHGTIRSRNPFGAWIATALMTSFGLESMASGQTVYETQMAKQPLDVVLTPNARLAIVRGHAPGSSNTDGITVIDTSTGNKLLLIQCAASGLGGAAIPQNAPSDLLQATNSRAVLIGGLDTDLDGIEDTTLIDVLALDMGTSPPTVACLAHHVLGGPAQPAGLASDVEITPDETYAVVNSRNWIHVVRLADGSISAGFHIAAVPYAGPCSPEKQADSVALTNEVAVVTTSRDQTSGGLSRKRTWVYLIDLAGAVDPVIQFEHHLSYPISSNFELVDFSPHDLAITPGGTLAVVCASDVVGVYDLSGFRFLARHRTIDLGIRRYPETVDSIAVTNERALVVGKDRVGSSPNESHCWTVTTYDLQPTAWPPTHDMLPLFIHNSRTEGFLGNDPAHDLAIDSSGSTVVIRTFLQAAVVTPLDAVPPAAPVVYPLNLFNTSGHVLGNGTYWAFVSDSVLIAPDFYVEGPVGGTGTSHKHYAMILGYHWFYPYAYVDVLDLTATPPTTLAHTFALEDSTKPRILPTDIALGLGRDFWVRFDAQPDDPGVGTGRDVIRFGLDPLGEILPRFGASGSVTAVDSLVRNRAAVGSVSEDLQFSTGFVHVVRP